MKIPVVKRLNKTEFSIEVIDMSDVLHVYTIDNILHYQTRSGLYTHIYRLEEMERYLTSLEQGFRRVERGYIAQLSEDAYYDKDLHVLRYAQSPNVHTPVARSYQRVLREENVPTTKESACQGEFNRMNRGFN